MILFWGSWAYTPLFIEATTYMKLRVKVKRTTKIIIFSAALCRHKFSLIALPACSTNSHRRLSGRVGGIDYSASLLIT